MQSILRASKVVRRTLRGVALAFLNQYVL